MYTVTDNTKMITKVEDRHFILDLDRSLSLPLSSSALKIKSKKYSDRNKNNDIV